MLPLTPSLPILTGTPGGPISLLPQTPPPPIQFFTGQDPSKLLPMSGVGSALNADFNSMYSSPSPGVPFGGGGEDDFVVGGGGCWPLQFSPPTPDILREINPYFGCSPSPPALQTNGSPTPPPLQFAPLSTCGTPPELTAKELSEAAGSEAAGEAVTHDDETANQSIAIPGPSSSPVAALNPIISPPLNFNPFLFQMFCRI